MLGPLDPCWLVLFGGTHDRAFGFIAEKSDFSAWLEFAGSYVLFKVRLFWVGVNDGGVHGLLVALRVLEGTKLAAKLNLLLVVVFICTGV